MFLNQDAQYKLVALFILGQSCENTKTSFSKASPLALETKLIGIYFSPSTKAAYDRNMECTQS